MQGTLLFVFPAILIFASIANAQTAYALNGRVLYRFDLNSPGNTEQIGTLPPRTWKGLDFKPETSQLYALSVDSSATCELYTVNINNAQPMFVGAIPGGQFSLTSSANLGFDFFPVASLVDGSFSISIVDAETYSHIRILSTNGQVIGPETPLNFGISSLFGFSGIAWSNNRPSLGRAPVLYSISWPNLHKRNQSNPNPAVGGLGIQEAFSDCSFDIYTATNGLNFGYAAIIIDGVPKLYSINLFSGAANLIGTINMPTVNAFAIDPLSIPATPTPIPTVPPTATATATSTPTETATPTASQIPCPSSPFVCEVDPNCPTVFSNPRINICSRTAGTNNFAKRAFLRDTAISKLQGVTGLPGQFVNGLCCDCQCSCTAVGSVAIPLPGT